MTVKDLQTAELLLIKEVQRQAFPAEVKDLETYKKEQRSEIHGRERKVTKRYQAPFIALIQIWTKMASYALEDVSLKPACLAYIVKHTVLLPKKGHLTDLIVRHFHQRTGHQG